MSDQASITIRPLRYVDVRAVLDLLAAQRRACAASDSSLPQSLLQPSDYALFDRYRRRRSAYFVAADSTQIIGGAGIAALHDGDWTSCELQRVCLQPDSRPEVALRLLQACLDAARSMRFERCELHADGIDAALLRSAGIDRIHDLMDYAADHLVRATPPPAPGAERDQSNTSSST